MALTGGVASAVSAAWVRRRVLEQMEDSDEITTIWDRIRNRGKFALAGIAFTSCATLVSGSVDMIERTLGFAHRTEGHSLPFLGGLASTAYVAKQKGTDIVERVCRKFDVPESVEEVADALQDLASWVLSGGVTGVVTHWLGDIPTNGHGGTALRLLAPISNVKFNLGLLASASPTLNSLAMGVGGILAAGSWLTTAAYLVTPKPLNKLLQSIGLGDILSSLKRIFGLESTRAPLTAPLRSSSDQVIASQAPLQANTVEASGGTPLQRDSENSVPLKSSLEEDSSADEDYTGVPLRDSG